MTQLIAIENHHRVDPPAIPEDGYRGYFQNKHGEQILFHQARGEQHATVWHGDADFESYRVERGQAPELVLSLGEKLWVIACWEESSFLRLDDVPTEDDTKKTVREVAAAVIDITEGFGGNQLFGDALAAEITERMEKMRGS